MPAPPLLDCANPLSSAVSGPPSRIAHLRRLVGGVGAAPEEHKGGISFALAPLDHALCGGLAAGALHEIASADETQLAAATGFVLSLAARAPRSWIVWVAESSSLQESGAPYGPGLLDIGLNPERLVTVAASQPRETLWAMEEALRCPAVGAVIGETRAQSLDLVSTRRLSLAAQQRSGLALLLRTGPAHEPSAAATRWIVEATAAPRHACGSFFLSGGPRLALHLVRNRRGLPGSWLVEWNRADQRFELADPEPVVEPALNRPRQARA